MQSLKAKILQLEDHILTIRILDADVVCLAGKDIRINGLKASSVKPVPCSESDASKTDFANALIYRLAEQDKTNSFTVGTLCEVTWDEAS
jgi:hypothetical protein